MNVQLMNFINNLNKLIPNENKILYLKFLKMTQKLENQI